METTEEGTPDWCTLSWYIGGVVMEYNLKVMNKIYLMRLYAEAYRKKYI